MPPPFFLFAGISIFPALLHRLAYPLGIFLPVVLVEVARFHVGGARGIGVVEKTVNKDPRISTLTLYPFPFDAYASKLCSAKGEMDIPLHTRQDRRHIVRRTPPILQDIQT